MPKSCKRSWLLAGSADLPSERVGTHVPIVCHTAIPPCPRSACPWHSRRTGGVFCILCRTENKRQPCVSLFPRGPGTPMRRRCMNVQAQPGGVALSEVYYIIMRVLRLEWTTARLEFQGALDACRHSILARAEELLSDSRALYFVVPLIGNMVDTLSPSLQDTGIKAARQRGASHIVRLLFRALLGRDTDPLFRTSSRPPRPWPARPCATSLTR